MTITPHIFEAYLKCSTKCWLTAVGKYATGNAYAEWIKTQKESHRAGGTERLLMEAPHKECVISPCPEHLKAAKWRLAVNVGISTLTPCVANCEQRAHHVAQECWPSDSDSILPQVTSSADTFSQQELETSQLAAMVPALGPTADSCDLATNLHAIECLRPKGRGKPAQFVPIHFVYTNQVDKDDRLMLAFDALTLSGLLGHEVTCGKIIHGDDYHTLKVKTSVLTDEVRKRITNIAALLANSAPPDLVLNSHCAECEFQAHCRKIAAEKDDLSLVSSMSAKERKALRSKGIFTVTQLSYTFRPRRRPKILLGKRERYHHSLKALAIREKRIHLVGSPALKFEGTPVYLDVEGLPDRKFYYLIGIRIGEGQDAVQHSLWADAVEDEGKIWNEFLGVLATVEKPILLHYGSYDATFLTQMQRRHGIPRKTNVSTATAIEQPRNLLSVIFATVYFPTFSNGLKDIARWLGFKWSEPEASGIASIIWRHRWEESQSDEFKQKLITYNAEDCEALSRLGKHLVELSAESEEAKPNNSADVVHTETLPRNCLDTFKRNHFEFADFERINQAAYWDYQREKILVRSSERLKRIVRSAGKKRSIKCRINKFIDWPGPSDCPKCGSLKIYKHQTARKTVIDIRFGPTSIRKWVTTYLFHRYRCPMCGAVFYNSDRAWSGGKFGWNLRAFCVYLNVELRVSQLRIAAFLNLILGFQLPRSVVSKFKASVASRYQAAYESLLLSIVNGALVHADETKVNLGGQVGYVWVFTNLEEAVYLYSPSREGELVQRVLKDFKGVLVSDFYSVYDSLNCAQQKCLIHLIRDLNNELLTEPFNEEFKALVGEIAALLKPMIETIDRFGLKARYLRRHKIDVDCFFKRLSRRACRSETSQKFKQRLERYRDKLFTFLDHDGVPWNNNNAEHAVKAFALLRKEFVGLSTEKGIKDYLILLSIRETCRFKGVSFLKFLRSGETDLTTFAEGQRSLRRHERISAPSKKEEGGGMRRAAERRGR